MFTPKIKSFMFIAVLGALVLAACGTPLAPAAQTSPSEQPHTITVTGNGSAYGTPDKAVATVGIEERNRDAKEAVGTANAKMNAIMDAMKALGIDPKDLQTTNFSIYAQQDYSPDGTPLTTYTYVVNNTLNIIIRDLGKVGEVLGQAIEAGANSVGGVSFGVEDQTALEAQARDLAMADAKARAEQLARAAGVTLDTPMTISEYTSGPIMYASDVKAVGLGAGGSAPVPVASGQLQVTMQVNVTYIIK